VLSCCARDRVRDFLLQHCAERPLIDDVVLCIEEACTNAIRHSQAADDIEISLEFADGDLVALVKDNRRGFDVDAFDPEALPDLSSEHGRGLYLISHLSDEMELRRDGGLEVRMVKRAVTRSEAPVLESGLGNVDIPPQLAHREARTRALLEEIDEGFFALDWEYRVVHANRVALRLCGEPLEHVRGLTPWELFPYVKDGPLFAAFREAMTVGRPSVLAYRFVATGDWLEVRISPTGAGLSAYYREINERKAAEEELLRYRLLSRQARDIMLFVRSADGRILEANAAAETAYRCTREELLARSIDELRAEEHWFELYGAVALTGEPARFMAPAAALGRYYDVSAFRLAGPDSRQVGILFNDISERWQADEERRRLNEVNDLIHSTLRVEEIMQRVVASAAEAVGSDSAMVALKHGDDWVAEYGYPEVPGVIHESVRSDEASVMITAVTQLIPVDYYYYYYATPHSDDVSISVVVYPLALLALVLLAIWDSRRVAKDVPIEIPVKTGGDA
jgi:PAS domain S-box-containing protein